MSTVRKHLYQLQRVKRPLMALNSLYCADVPLSNYSLARLCPCEPQTKLWTLKTVTLLKLRNKQHTYITGFLVTLGTSCCKACRTAWTVLLINVPARMPHIGVSFS